MQPFYYKKCGPNNMKILDRETNKNVSLTFNEMVITSIDFSTKKYIYLKADVSNDTNRNYYQYIDSIDDKIDEIVSESKKTYIKSIINGDVLKIKVPFNNDFQVNTNALMYELFQDQSVYNVTIELNNVYIIDKYRYLITGPIWLLRSFTV